VLSRRAATGSVLSRRGALLLAAGGLAQLSLPRALPAAPPARGAAAAGPARPEIERLLAARGAALARSDADLLLTGVDPARYLGQRELLDRLAGVPFAEFGYRLTSYTEPAPGAERLSVGAELGYRLTGVDGYPATLDRRLEFARGPGGWLLSTEEPVGPAALWDLGPVRIARGRRSLVLGTGEPAALDELAQLGDRALPLVGEAWGEPPGGPLLLELPATEQEFARLLDVPADTYRGIAAVTLAAAGAPVRTPADRVLVNPEAYRELSQLGRRVVVTHEVTHVATRADTRAWTPLWLSEGVADWTAYRGTGRTARQIAPELTREAEAGRLPQALPEDTAFTAGAAGISQAYELSWLACQLIADQYGADRLVALYRAVGAGGSSAEPRGALLERAFRAELGLGVAEFTKRWVGEAAKLARVGTRGG